MPLAWSLACPDWQDRIRAGRSLLPSLPGINATQVQRARGIFDRLQLPDVPGKPLLADAAGEWFREIVGVMLGCLDPITGERLIRELFLLACKKQSKTSYGAAMMLTALLMNKRPRAEFLFIGPTKMISDLAFDQAEGMIEADPEGLLPRRLHVQGHLKQITDRRNKAQLLIKTFDASVLTGVKPAGVLIDELHEMAKNAKASRIIGQIRGGLLPIPEAFLAFITTQSDEPPSGAFRAELQTARAIRDGRATGAMLPVLYEFPPAIMMDRGEPPAWQDPKNWPMVMPNLGRSVTIERLLPDFVTAKQKGDDELRRWASQHLNIEIGLALSSDRWAGADHWEAAVEPGLTLEALLERCDVVVVGIDGGGLDDLLGLAVLGRESVTRRWLLWSHAFAHRVALERRKSEAAKWQDYETDGDLTIVDQLGEDVEQMADIVEQVADSGLMPDRNAVGMDSVGIGQIVDALDERGVGNVEGAPPRIVGISQGWKLSGAIKTMERKLADGTFVHGGARLMAYCLGNAKVEPRGNAITITKQTAGAAKIDPLVAAFNAAALMMMNPAGGVSVYDRAAADDRTGEAQGAVETAGAGVVGARGDAVRPRAGAVPAAATAQELSDAEILVDPQHPGFMAARRRWDERQALRDEDDF